MTIASTLHQYLKQQGTNFDILRHSHTGSSLETASAAHIAEDRLAKAVVVEDDRGYLMVVIPSRHRLHLGRLHKACGRLMGLATEEELRSLFPDCELGAIPPVGTAYGIETVVDDALSRQPDVYLEAGDHEALVHLSGEQFNMLMHDMPKGQYSEHP